MQALEEIGNSFEGVQQHLRDPGRPRGAGMVEARGCNDLAAIRMAKDIAKKIEDNLGVRRRLRSWWSASASGGNGQEVDHRDAAGTFSRESPQRLWPRELRFLVMFRRAGCGENYLIVIPQTMQPSHRDVERSHLSACHARRQGDGRDERLRAGAGARARPPRARGRRVHPSQDPAIPRSAAGWATASA